MKNSIQRNCLIKTVEKRQRRVMIHWEILDYRGGKIYWLVHQTEKQIVFSYGIFITEMLNKKVLSRRLLIKSENRVKLSFCDGFN